MSDQITTAFVKQFGRTVDLLSQEKGNKFRKAVRIEPMNAEFAFIEQIGPTKAVRSNSRHADSPLVNTEHKRRRVGLLNVEWGDLIDRFDRVRLLIDPTDPYTMNAGLAVGRELDLILIEKFFADAFTGKEGTVAVPFPAANEVAVDLGGTPVGLTVEKLRAARKKLKQNKVDLEVEPVWGAIDAEREDDLLGSTQVTSIDFNTIRALVNGDVNQFLGMQFIKTEQLELDASGHIQIPIWTPSGMVLAVGMDTTAKMAERADKRFSIYVYYSAVAGATRAEEEKVIKILAV